MTDSTDCGTPRCVAFVGPLPPPIHGFSNVCAMMLDLLRSRMKVAIFDRAPIAGRRLVSAGRQVARLLHYPRTCVADRDGILYLALSGGRGQLIDAGYLLIGKLFRRRIFVHHHSFSYVNHPSLLNRCIFSLVRKETHVVLSEQMGSELSRLYGLDLTRMTVVSNAAFYEATPAEGSIRAGGETLPLRIGFLSNITFDKGFVEFFEILKCLKGRGILFRASIAGPLAPEANEAFHALLAEVPGVEYLGPLYGEAKERFYQQLDIFLFPTKYENEAEPLVVYEAMRQGVYVIAGDRGAITEMLRNGAGVALDKDSIIASAAAHIHQFSDDRRALTAARLLASQQAQRMRSAGQTALMKLLARMQGSPGEESCVGAM